MLNNFLEQTILTGKMNHEYLNNFPNSLLVESNYKYKLAITNKSLVLVFDINIPEIIAQELKLPILSSSKNYIIDWDDGYTTTVLQPQYRNNNKPELAYPGEFYIENNIVYIFNGSKFIQKDGLTIENLCKNRSENYRYYIIEQNNNFISDNLLLVTKFEATHTYRKAGKYYIKISGGFTGFDNHNATDNFNPFYLVAKKTAGINTNVICLSNISNPEFTNCQVIGEYNYYNTAENSTVSGEYVYYQDEDLYKNNAADTTVRKIYFKNNKCYLKCNSTDYIISCTNNDPVLSDVTALANNVDGYAAQIKKSAVIKSDITIGCFVVPTKYNLLTEILSWGTDINWQTLKSAFYNAKALETIPEETLPNVNDYTSAFAGCESLTKLPNFNILPHALIWSSHMFDGTNITTNLSANYTIPSFNTVVDYMFANTKITSIPSNFLTKNYYNVSGCFYNVANVSSNIELIGQYPESLSGN